MLFSYPSECNSKEIISDVVHRHIAKIRLDSDLWQEQTHIQNVLHVNILKCIVPISTATRNLVC